VTDFGVDLSCVSDIEPSFDLVRGRTALAQALARRLGTPRGGLFYDPTYGYDLRAHLNAAIGPLDTFAIGAAVETECERDERVQRTTATVSFNAQTERLRVALVVEDADGPFPLVLEVSAVTVEILSSQT
jgi:phage baseplate assembly protein W